MLKSTFLNVCIFLFVKCIVFYFFLMLVNNDFTMLKGIFHIKSGKDLFYYLWIVLVFPILDVIIFSLPIYYSLKKSKIWLSLIFICFMIEYTLYVYSKKEILNTDAIANFLISFIVLLIFFYKPIWKKITVSQKIKSQP